MLATLYSEHSGLGISGQLATLWKELVADVRGQFPRSRFRHDDNAPDIGPPTPVNRRLSPKVAAILKNGCCFSMPSPPKLRADLEQ